MGRPISGVVIVLDVGEVGYRTSSTMTVKCKQLEKITLGQHERGAVVVL